MPARNREVPRVAKGSYQRLEYKPTSARPAYDAAFVAGNAVGRCRKDRVQKVNTNGTYNPRDQVEKSSQEGMMT